MEHVDLTYEDSTLNPMPSTPYGKMFSKHFIKLSQQPIHLLQTLAYYKRGPGNVLASKLLYTPTHEDTTIINKMMQVVNAMPRLDAPIQVWRGIGGIDALDLQRMSLSFVSTSLSYTIALSIANGNRGIKTSCCLLRITIPAGMKVIPLAFVGSKFRSQLEVLISPWNEWSIADTSTDPKSGKTIYDLIITPNIRTMSSSFLYQPRIPMVPIPMNASTKDWSAVLRGDSEHVISSGQTFYMCTNPVAHCYDAIYYSNYCAGTTYEEYATNKCRVCHYCTYLMDPKLYVAYPTMLPYDLYKYIDREAYSLPPERWEGYARAARG